MAIDTRELIVNVYNSILKSMIILTIIGCIYLFFKSGIMPNVLADYKGLTYIGKMLRPTNVLWM